MNIVTIYLNSSYLYKCNYCKKEYSALAWNKQTSWEFGNGIVCIESHEFYFRSIEEQMGMLYVCPHCRRENEYQIMEKRRIVHA